MDRPNDDYFIHGVNDNKTLNDTMILLHFRLWILALTDDETVNSPFLSRYCFIAPYQTPTILFDTQKAARANSGKKNMT